MREPSQIRGIRLGLQACPFNSGNCPENGDIEARADLDYQFTEGVPLLIKNMGARLTLGLVAGLLLGCGTMQDMPLYDLDLRPTAEERVLNHVHRDIYLDEANSIMFGQKPHPCKRVEVVEGSAEGADHVRVEWSQSDSCRYLGVGFHGAITWAKT